MKIVVIGAGAIGSTMAARLTQSGTQVTLIARGARLAQLSAKPLELERDDTVQFVPVTCCDWHELKSPLDLAIVCTKTPDLPDVFNRMQSSITPETTILTLQNGIEAHEQAARRFPHATIVAARVHGFFEMDGARVRHVGVQPSILYGCVRGKARQAQAVIARLFDQADFRAQASPDIVKALWEKFMLTASLGGVAAALCIPAGQVLAHPRGKAMLQSAMQEIVRLGNQRGIALGVADIDRTIAFVAKFPPEATTSLQRDLANGHPSEYDALTGAVVRMARTDMVQCPTFHAIDQAINGIRPDR